MKPDDDVLELLRRVDPVPDVDRVAAYVGVTDPVWHTIVARATREVDGDVDTDVEHGRVEAPNPRGIWRIGLVAAAVATLAALLVITVPQRETGPSFVEPGAVDVCTLLEHADRQADPRRDTAAEVLPLPDTSWGAHVCAVDVFDLDTECTLLQADKQCGFNYLHLLWYAQPITSEEASRLIARPSLLLPAIDWGDDGPDRWTTGWVNGVDETFLGAAVAVAEEPYFFVVTDRDEVKAGAVADAIVELLNDLPTRND